MSLRLTLAPSFSVARPLALASWGARGGLLVVPRRSAVTEALLAESAAGVLIDREAVTFAGLRSRVLDAAAASEPEVPTRLGIRLALREVLDTLDLTAFGDSAGAPGFLTGVERAIGELRVARIPPARLAAAAVTPVGRAVADIHAAAWDAVVHPADAVWTAAEAAAGLGYFPPVTVGGFDDLVPGQWALLRALGEISEIEVVMPFAAGRPAFEARHARQERWAEGAIVEVVKGVPPVGPALLARRLFEEEGFARIPPPAMIGAAGTRGMLRSALEAALGAVESGTPLSRVAVVVPRLSEVREDLGRLLGDWSVPFRASSRVRVLEAPLALALTHLLRLGELKPGESGALDHLLGWLRTPYSAADSAEVDRFEAAARRGGIASRGGLMARWHVNAIEPARRLVATAARGPRAQLGAMVDLGWEALRRASAGRPPSAADLRDRAALTALAGAARAFDEEEATPEDEPSRARGPLPPGALGEVVADLSVIARDEEHGGLDLHDFASIRGSDYDVVVLAGVDGDGYPGRPAADPFLAELRPGLADVLPPRAPGTTESRLRFTHAVDAARERLVLIRRVVDDDGREVAPSPYWVEVARHTGRDIDQLDARTGARGEVPESPASARSAREALRAVALANEVAPGLLAEAVGRRVRRTGVGATAFLGRTTFRVTELEGYLRCPYGWFHSTILDPAEMDEAIDPRFEGSFGHHVLERVYREMSCAGVGACVPATLGRYRAALSEAIEEEARTQRPEGAGATYDAMVERMRRHLAAVLGRDAALESPLVPREFERRMLDDVILGDIAPGLVLSGQVDRLDVGPSGALVVDYKRTSGTFSAKSADVTKRLQLPLYGVMATNVLALGVPAVGGLYMGLLSPSLTGAVRDDVAGPSVPSRLHVSDERWEEITADAVAAARDAVVAIREGRLDPPTPDDCVPWCNCGDLWR